MQLIKPSQISGEIMTLIEEADEKIIIVSPYIKISKWHKLLQRLETIKKRNIEVEIFVREGEKESIAEVVQIGFEPILIPNLHSKLYLNEKQGIVSSMNLHYSSDTKSLDIAYKTESTNEYVDLKAYYTRYIETWVHQKYQTVSKDADWRNYLNRTLNEAFGRNVHFKEFEGTLLINTSNKYEIFIANDSTNKLKISGILSNREFDFTIRNKGLFQSSKMEIEIVKGKQGCYDMVWGTISGIKSWSVNDLHPGEALEIIDAIVKFISGIEQFKRMVY